MRRERFVTPWRSERRHGNAFRGGYSYNGGARHYDDISVGNIVRNSYAEHAGGSYRAPGKVVAPRENVPVINRSAAPGQAQVTQQRSSEPRRVISRRPDIRQAAAKTPVVRQPVPVVRQPVTNQPVVRQPVLRQPVVQQPAAPQVGDRQNSPRQSAPRTENTHDRRGGAR